MKKQVLFVDDESNILKGLQRSLRPLRKYWDMVFSNSGEDALKLLEKQSFDVIVTDMRMPGMDGAQLLKIVQNKYPMMVRIILSGHSDQEMIMKTVKAAHQYLSKPCEKKLLVTTITRACSLQDLLNRNALRRLVGGIETIPTIPSLYAQIVDELKSSDASAASVGAIISKDIGMTAKMLQLVNSSFFGMPRHISNTQEAVILLGIDVVKTLVLGIEVFSKFSKNESAIIFADKINEHCVRTGVIAQKIAKLEKLDKKEIDNTMIASILHDLGKLLMIENFPDEYRDVMEIVEQKKVPFFKAENEVFCVTHAEVGAYLLGLWGLPQAIIEGIAFHHKPSRLVSKEFGLCGLVHISELMEQHSKGNLEHLSGIDEQYIEKIGLADRIPLWWGCLEKK